MKVYVLSYCQNDYQRKRVRDFVEQQGEIVNPEFGVRYCDVLGHRKGSSRLLVHDNESDLIKAADEVWFIVGKSSVYSFSGQFGDFKEFMKFLRGSRKPRKYFKIAQTGKYVGRAKRITKKELGGVK